MGQVSDNTTITMFAIGVNKLEICGNNKWP